MGEKKRRDVRRDIYRWMQADRFRGLLAPWLSWLRTAQTLHGWMAERKKQSMSGEHSELDRCNEGGGNSVEGAM